MTSAEINWPDALRATNNAAALGELRGILLNGLRIAFRHRSDVSDALCEDFAEEALLKILDRLDQFSVRSKFTTWAHTVAIHTAFTELRRKRWQDVSLDALVADESRFGLHTQSRRRWALRGQRVVIPQQQCYEWEYVYGALEVVPGEAQFRYMPSVSLELSVGFLEQIAPLTGLL